MVSLDRTFVFIMYQHLPLSLERVEGAQPGATDGNEIANDVNKEVLIGGDTQNNRSTF